MAQSRAAGDRFARYWMHNGLVRIGGEKMSKSLGNSLLVDAMVATVRPVELRYYLGQAHYRSEIDYSPEALAEAATAYRRIEGFVTRAAERLGGGRGAGRRLARPGCRGRSPRPWTMTSGVPQALAVVHDAVARGQQRPGRRRRRRTAKQPGPGPGHARRAGPGPAGRAVGQQRTGQRRPARGGRRAGQGRPGPAAGGPGSARTTPPPTRIRDGLQAAGIAGRGHPATARAGRSSDERAAQAAAATGRGTAAGRRPAADASQASRGRAPAATAAQAGGQGPDAARRDASGPPGPAPGRRPGQGGQPAGPRRAGPRAARADGTGPGRRWPVPRRRPGQPVTRRVGRRAQRGAGGAARPVPAMALHVGPRPDTDERIREAVSWPPTLVSRCVEAGRSELDRLTGGAVHQGVALQRPALRLRCCPTT